MPQVKKKEKWGKPKLLILTRGKPEEKILLGCKWCTWPCTDGGPTPNVGFQSLCDRRVSPTNPSCDYCSSLTLS
jgi:hypothetical protein